MTALEPRSTTRPYMPDYPRDPEGDRLLPWSWAVERLERSTEYWLGTVGADGRPAVTPVWGVLLDGAMWFSCGPSSRKARHLERRPHLTMTTNDAKEPVIIEGTASLVTGDRPALEGFAEANEAKYHVGSSLEFYETNALFRVQPQVVIGMIEDDFFGSPTKWRF